MCSLRLSVSASNLRRRRGTAVTGGESHRVSVGDVVHIPANTPHQMLVDAGHQVTYFVVKVESR
jgi:quercetin dioxygenase-like cupin family protein